MTTTIDYITKQYQAGEGPPASLIELLKSYFSHNIRDLQTWEYYFLGTTTHEPWIQWLEHEGLPIAHYAMFFYDFTSADGRTIKGGKPELPCVSKEFLHKCLREKLDYTKNNPIEVLNKNLLQFVKTNDIKVLFTWPNELALNTYRQEGYKIHNVSVQTFWSFFDHNFLVNKLNKKFNNLILAKISKIFIDLVFWPLRLYQSWKCFVLAKRVVLKEIDSFKDIPFQDIWKSFSQKLGQNVLVPEKNASILDHKFSHARFHKFYFKNKKEEGYLVLNYDPAEKIAKIVDYASSKKLFYEMLPVLIRHLAKEKMMQALLFRNYQGPNRKSPLNLWFKGSLLPGRTFKRFLAWKTSEKKLEYDKKRFHINDYLSDFSIF